jgi:LacI family transcriptional regulator
MAEPSGGGQGRSGDGASQRRRERASERPGMREVAEHAGVAMSSVSRVLSHHPDVSSEMRERVERAVDELGYQPDMLAQSLRRRATFTVGFVVSDISNPLLSTIALGAETTLREAGYSMLLMNSENKPSLDAAHLRLLTRRRVDGLLLSLAAEDDPETVGLLETTDIPIVLIDRELPPSVEAGSVISEHRDGMRNAVGTLLDLGHRRVGLILGPSLRFSRERLLGLRDAYAERGLADESLVLEGTLTEEFGREATARMLDDRSPVTAIVAGGNQLVSGALAELRARDIQVGDDISLVSCDAISVTEFFNPPIAVVRRDNRELGRKAAQLLLEQMRDDRPPRQIVLPTEFVQRASCAPPPPARQPA